jgi:hypothetical protein
MINLTVWDRLQNIWDTLQSISPGASGRWESAQGRHLSPFPHLRRASMSDPASEPESSDASEAESDESAAGDTETDDGPRPLRNAVAALEAMLRGGSSSDRE